jgi:hypothetical protein
MKLRKHSRWIALLAAMFVFSQAVAAAHLCLMDMAGAAQAVASDEAPCDMHGDEAAGTPEDCCATLGMDHSNDGQFGAAGYVPVPILPVLAIARFTGWPKQVSIAAPPAQRIASPPPSIVFKNFRA